MTLFDAMGNLMTSIKHNEFTVCFSVNLINNIQMNQNF
jgi:hypothetical protein